MAHVESIWVYPIKGFDAMEVESSSITQAGILAWDRAYAVVDADGETLNGKDIDYLHEITSAFDPETDVLTLSVHEANTTHQFGLTTEQDEINEWLSGFVGEPVELCRREPLSFVDRPELGPSVISTETLEEIASWFDGMTTESARRRLRPNIEVGGVPAFWEDRFLGDDPSFEIGGTRFMGAEACARCVVPSRDPDNGEQTEEFRRRFVEHRRETLPEWVDEDTFDHLYTVMLITTVPEAYRGEEIRVGETVMDE